MNPFDELAQNVFNVVTDTMGYQAAWTPSTGGDQKTAGVGYHDPTSMYKILADVQFNPHQYGMEFKDGDLSGLKTNVDNGLSESVSITFKDGVKSYYVRQVNSIHDGKCFLAFLERYD